MNESRDEQADEARIEALLRRVGPRVTPPETLTRQVRDAVKREWQENVRRTRRRRVRLVAAVASLAIAVSTGVAVTLMTAAPAAQIALVSRIEGHVSGDAGWLHPSRELHPGSELHVGDEISTARSARAALHLEDGLAVRLDENTSVRLASTDRLVLEQGAVYVASDPQAERSATFTVATRHGTVRHIGTQYEVRTIANGMQVSVREGRVVIDREGALHEGKAGERIAIGNDGAVSRTHLPLTDPYWRWVYGIAPGFDIENRTLDAFLSWFSRETGHTIEFASDAVAQSAHATVLRGSIEGLGPQAALAAVLATTDLTSSEADDGRIVIRSRE